MAEHKDTVPQDGFHCRNSPMQARHWQLHGHARTATVQNVHKEEEKYRPMVWTVRVFICLAHPSLCIIKNKLAPSRTLEKRWFGPYNELRPQFFKQEAASGRGANPTCLDTSFKNLRLFVSLSPSLACLRVSPALQSNPSRHTLGWRPTVAA